MTAEQSSISYLGHTTDGSLEAAWSTGRPEMLNASAQGNASRPLDSHCSSQPVDAFLAAYRFAINVVILGIISVIGIIGNVITGVVLKTDKSSYKGSSSSTSFILLSLAVCDTLFAISSILAQLLPTVFHHFQVSHEVSNFEARMFPFAFYFGSAVRMMRNWTIVLVSIERWIAIFKPLHAQVICTVKKAKVAVTVIVLTAASYNVPRFIEATPIEVDCRNYTMLVYTRSPLRANWAYQYVYMISLYMVFVIAGPMLVLTVLNFLLMRAIRQVAVQRERLMETSRTVAKQHEQPRNGNCVGTIEHQQRADCCLSPPSVVPRDREAARTDAAQAGSKHRQKAKMKSEITRMCVGIIMLYIICELPALIYQIMFYLKVSRSVTVYIQPISNGLVALNSALNFFVYVFLGKRFRRRVTELLRCQCSSSTTRRPSRLRLKLINAESSATAPLRHHTHVTFDETSLRHSQA